MRHLAPLAFVAVSLAACLPNSLSDAEVAARIADATSHDTGVAMCGNKVTEDKELCDDGDSDVCNGCDACELRRVLHVTDGNQFAVASSSAFEFLTNNTLKSKGDQVSVSLWLKLASLPPVGKPAPLVALAPDKADPAFAISVLNNGSNAFAACTLRSPVLDKSAVSAVVMKPGEWHHLRCTIAVDKTAPTGQLHMYLSVDGATPKEETLALPTMPYKTTQLALGGFPATQQTSTLQGWLDELHITADPDPKVRQLVQYRVSANQAGLLLYHMDIREGDKLLRDAAAGGVNAMQTSPGAGQANQKLAYDADQCYGFGSPKCGGAGKQGPWCQ